MGKPEPRNSSSSLSDRIIPVKRRRAVPYPFVLDALAELPTETRMMFGCLAIYLGDRIVLMLRDRQQGTVDNGVWLATTEEHRDSLREEFPSMRSIDLFGKQSTGWQILPADSVDFETAALRACEMIGAGDPRIGKVPKSRRSAKSIKAKKSRAV